MARDELPELVFITVPLMGHLSPLVETVGRMIAQDPDHRLSALFLIMNIPFPGDTKITSYIESLKSNDDDQSTSTSMMNLLELPPITLPPTAIKDLIYSHIEAYKPIIKQTLTDRYSTLQRRSLAGLTLGFFCTSLVDVADDLGVPSYIFYSSGALMLSLTLHLESLHADIPAEYGGRSPDETVIELGGFKNPIPLKVWPRVFLEKDGGSKSFLQHGARFRRTRGILVNTFMELETSIIRSLMSSDDSANKYGEEGHVPPVYTVGPAVSMNDDYVDEDEKTRIINWLDSQRDCSVVFLCFGSRGAFEEDQVKEIATALERSGQRFLWSLRPKVIIKGGNFDDVLPEGFLERTAEVGLVIGWAPQIAVLGHKSVGAFMSHCGWNSILESLWFGVPILTWPMMAEQQLNAFALVEEWGLGVEVRMDYVSDFREINMVVCADEIERAIRKMMEEEDGERVRRNTKRMSEMGKKAILEGDGSSYKSMDRFIQDVLANVS